MSNKVIPPGQYQIKPDINGKVTWPILTASYPPGFDKTTWKLKIHGKVENPIELNWDQFNELPKTTLIADMHCVTKWTIFDMKWEGVNFYDIVKIVKPTKEAISVMFKSNDEIEYTTSVMFNQNQKLFFPSQFNEKKYIEYEQALLATKNNEEPLSDYHGGPMRIIIPDLYAWKGAKFCTEIEFMDKHKMGFWEVRGYSDTADPYTEDRYTSDIARTLKAAIYLQLRNHPSKKP